MFAAYFIPAFANAEEIHIARQTAASVSAYIINNHGIEAFLYECGQSYIQSWLNSIGAERVYTNPYAGMFDGFRYRSSEQWPLIISSPRGDVFYVRQQTRGASNNPAWNRSMVGEFHFHSAEYIKNTIYHGINGLNNIFEYIKTEAPDYYQTVKNNYSQPIHYYFGMPQGNAFVNNRRVDLATGEQFIHETLHILLPWEMGLNAFTWKGETIVDYLEWNHSNVNVMGVDMLREDIYNFLTCDDYLEITFREAMGDFFDYDILTASIRFGDIVKEMYLKRTFMPNTLDDADYVAYMCGRRGILLFKKREIADRKRSFWGSLCIPEQPS
jgi:hypothetical protein